MSGVCAQSSKHTVFGRQEKTPRKVIKRSRFKDEDSQGQELPSDHHAI